MKISLPISIALCLLSVVGFWLWRTKDMDFMTPKNPPMLIKAQALVQPKADEPAPPSPAVLVKPSPLEIKITADAGLSPGLDAYRQFAQNEPPSTLLEFATLLLKKGQTQRSLLALERLIDSTNPSPAEISQAAPPIIQLRKTVAPWNLDPSATTELILSVSTSAKRHQSIQTALTRASQLIYQGSGQLVTLTPKLTTPKGKVPPNTIAPIILSLSSLDGHSTTSTLSATPSGETEKEIQQTLLTALYQIVQSQLAQKTTITIPPAPETITNHDILYQSQITRLAWQKLAQSLPLKEEKAPPAR